MAGKTIGHGSFFHQTDVNKLTRNASIDFLGEYKLFNTGRHAIRYVIDRINKKKQRNTIWLPRYYCQHVTEWMKTVFSNIRFYDIDPFDPSVHNVDFNTFSNDDIVLLNNFWGLYRYNIPKSANRPFFIEDHSHGWLSQSCIGSDADICIGSLRKTLPVPLGGIAWKPKKSEAEFNFSEIEPVDDCSTKDFYEMGWLPIEKAMWLKAQCKSESEKTIYLDLFAKAENYLHHQYEVIPLQKSHQSIIESFLGKNFLDYKKENLTYLAQHITDNDHFKIVQSENKGTSFGLNLAFKHHGIFDELKSFLISEHIYPSELWPNNTIDAEYRYLMNIHIDFRYTLHDMAFFADTINQFFTNIQP